MMAFALLPVRVHLAIVELRQLVVRPDEQLAELEPV